MEQPKTTPHSKEELITLIEKSDIVFNKDGSVILGVNKQSNDEFYKMKYELYHKTSEQIKSLKKKLEDAKELKDVILKSNSSKELIKNSVDCNFFKKIIDKIKDDFVIKST